ncbi:hypothetical protein MX003_00315 [Streptococcus uberis]|uniref:hypothetical protein n=1 Tax=Streptococcus uberis TaxID=1349 RepID=UPI0027DD14C0|nr:hypothetical protein [Streptococcus uberis]MCK1236186.1 hypothetical protein [Streptococcus uberis]
MVHKLLQIFFLAYSEKKHQFKNSPEDLNKLEELIKNINVKLTIISGKSEYSPFITKGLNTQNPITIVDFAAISKEVQSLNEAFQEKLEILKTGEVTKKNGVSPLEFVKKYYLVKEEPGKSKNFNKNNLSKALVEITDLILEERNGKYQLKESEELIVDKILFLSKIEKWWFWKNKSLGEKKTVLNTYGKNYFQSYVIHFYDVIIDADFEEFIDQIYLDFEKLLNDIETEKENNKVQKISYNVFKTDEWYKKMLFLLAKDTKRTLIDKNITESPEKGIENEGITKEINNVNEKIDDKEYNQKLLNYLKTNNKKPYQLMIIEFNKMNHYEFDNVRVIRRVNNRIKENFHLSVKTFSSIYSNIDMSEKIKNNEEFLEFPSFNNSVLREELSKKYNLVIIDIENDIEQNVTLLQNFQFELINSNL